MSELQHMAARESGHRVPWKGADAPAVFRVGVCERLQGATDAVRLPAQGVQVMTSGIPGFTPTGAVPDTFEEEARQAWRNVRKVLASAGAGLAHIVSVRTWLTQPDDVRTSTLIQEEFLNHQLVHSLAVVHQLVRPGMRIQLEVVASVPDDLE